MKLPVGARRRGRSLVRQLDSGSRKLGEDRLEEELLPQGTTVEQSHDVGIGVGARLDDLGFEGLLGLVKVGETSSQ